ncbi:MAG: aminopeptidase P family protein [Myxococcota bacterium]
MSEWNTVVEDHQLALSAQELEAVVRGVIAAPISTDTDGWMKLVATQRSSELTEALQTLKTRMAAETDFELNQAPAPSSRLEALRKKLAAIGVDGFWVPRADAFQNEIPPRKADRLRWLTGFSGSAGFAVVLPNEAALFVDGRYTLQAAQQTDPTAFVVRHSESETAKEWLLEHLRAGHRFAIDPWLHTEADIAPIQQACDARGAELVRIESNPIDSVWEKQPADPLAPVFIHPVDYAGENIKAKRADVAATLSKSGTQAAVLTAVDSVAWLTNLRGGDLPRTPAFLAYAIILEDTSMTLFVDERKLVDPEVHRHLKEIEIRPIDAFTDALDELASQSQRVLVDRSQTPLAVIDRLKAAGVVAVSQRDPVMLPKAKKNATELEGARAAHRRDGAAVSRFLFWLEREAAGGQLGEIAAAERLEAFRREHEMFRDLSFDTISGAGPNGAIIHYRVSSESERILERDNLYLVDSGAQYVDGTTDITRTVVIGEPSSEHRDRYTRVLKGHIALARAVFPRGTSGSQLDAFARQALWEVGLDYDHGTGHGVGSFLSVHEGPQRIANRPNAIALEPGMICSNEPGYYKKDAYGIRIENLVAVVPAPEITGAERSMLAFETLTLAPIDRRLIALEMLRADELAWLNRYHARVCETLAPLVDHETATWLREVTAPLNS